MGTNKYTNALFNENSPYLLQHAHNPVEWYPWGDEALEKAKSENKMLIVSIGYAACHWCHVMERESYEDTTVAKIMNEHFISIKVDREERPDIDDIYMSACQLTSGRNCGWPLNAFALPDGRPVWAGTYFPKQQWISILNQFINYQQEDPERLEEAANSLLQGLKQLDQVVTSDGAIELGTNSITEMHDGFLAQIDWEKGGRSGQPKFPLPSNYEFLLEYHHIFQTPKSLEAVEITLNNMAFGGIYDQLGGGFARYSVDKNWFAPHFEKMLYDNGQLVSLYAKAYMQTGKDLYRQTIHETLAFIEREMRSAEGGFYSSLDADSEGEEGRFYTWTWNELAEAIPGEEELSLFAEYYHCQPNGNWENGRNILYRRENRQAFAKNKGLETSIVKSSLDKSLSRLFSIRKERIRPGLDDKILTSWNALMLSGFVDAYKATGEKNYLETARSNAQFIRDKMMDDDFRLWRSYKEGQRKINGFLDDYAFTIKAFVLLYETSHDSEWLELAKSLSDYVLKHFYEASSHTLYYTSDLDPALVTRKTELNDNVIPGSVSQMAKNLFSLGHFYSDDTYLETASALYSKMVPTLKKVQQASYYSNWLSLSLKIEFPHYEIVIIGEEARQMAESFRKKYLPNAILIVSTEENKWPLTQDRLVEGKTMIYVCRNRVCKRPVDNSEDALKLLEE